MDWLKPIIEKININILIFAVAITTLGWWHFSKYEILIAISSCCSIYLAILLFYRSFQWLKANAIRRKREEELINDKIKEEQRIQQYIEIWFAGLPQFKINKLLQLLTWRAIPSATNVRIHTPDKELLLFNDYEFKIEMGCYNDPIILLCKIENNCSCSSLTYFLHPYLIKLLEDYQTNH